MAANVSDVALSVVRLQILQEILSIIFAGEFSHDYDPQLMTSRPESKGSRRRRRAAAPRRGGDALLIY
jgi:hypothetical protein